MKQVPGIPGDLVAKSKRFIHNVSVALRQLKPIQKRGHEGFLKIGFLKH